MKYVLYYNGNIITMNENNDVCECVVTLKDRIVFVGDKPTAISFLQNKRYESFNLSKRTITPGFIDGHSHFLFSALSRSLTVSLSQPPLGDVSSINDIIVKMTNHIKSRKLKPKTAVVGMGYDESLLDDNRIPTRDDLDKISKTRPVLIIHQSGHVAVFNSYLLNELGIDKNTSNPDGGIYGRYPNTKIPNGVAEETAMMNVQAKYFPKPKLKNLKEIFATGERIYTKHGITTIQEGGIKPFMLGIYRLAKIFKWLNVDIMGYFFANSKKDVIKYLRITRKSSKRRIGQLHLKGIKVLLDGSPQAKTAWLSKPYFVVPEGKDRNYSGYPLIPNENCVQEIYDEVVRNNLQVLTHTNGDQASEQLIRCFSLAKKRYNKTNDSRPVMIHAQTVRKDQLIKMAELNMLPSFFQMHTYFWGDWHLDSVLGPVRGQNISPTKWALDLNIKFNVHSDSPILPPDTMYMLWTATNRVTRSNRIIGSDHKLTVEQALRAQTIWSAYAYHLEKEIGSIEVNKKADMAILDKNPYDVPISNLSDISILYTIKNGKIIFKKNNT